MERYFAQVMDIPQLQARVECFLFAHQFASNAKRVSPSGTCYVSCTVLGSLSVFRDGGDHVMLCLQEVHSAQKNVFVIECTCLVRCTFRQLSNNNMLEQ